MSKITALASLTTPAAADELVIVDVDDTTMAPSGTDKNITVANLLAAITANDIPSTLNGTTIAGSLTTEGFVTRVNQVSSSYTATATDYLIEYVGNSSNGTITLPIVGLPAGQVIVVKNMSSIGYTTTVAAAGNGIDGSSSVNLFFLYDWMMLQWDGSIWTVISGNYMQGVFHASGGISGQTLSISNIAKFFGGVAFVAINTYTSNYTASQGDYVILCDATSGAFTITLNPSSAFLVSGQCFIIKKVDASGHAVTVSPSSGTIDGAGSSTLSAQYSTIAVTYDGTNWWITSRI